jgi:hypothetical protein
MNNLFLLLGNLKKINFALSRYLIARNDHIEIQVSLKHLQRIFKWNIIYFDCIVLRV